MQQNFSEEHNGFHAYRRICQQIGLTANLFWYSRPDGDCTGLLLTKKRKQEIVRIIEVEYQIPLNDADKTFILKMTTPRQLCEGFAERFNPNQYPALTSDWSQSSKMTFIGRSQGDKVAGPEKA